LGGSFGVGGVGQQVDGDFVAEFVVVTVDKSKAEDVLSWSGWQFKFYRYIQFFFWLDALVLQAESVVDNDGSVDQLELHIHGPCNLSRVLEFANCTEVGSCDSRELLRLVKARRLVGRLSGIKQWLKAEDLAQDAFKAEIAHFTIAVLLGRSFLHFRCVDSFNVRIVVILLQAVFCGT